MISLSDTIDPSSLPQLNAKELIGMLKQRWKFFKTSKKTQKKQKTLKTNSKKLTKKTSSEKCFTDVCAVSVHNVFTRINELKGKAYHKDQSALSTTSGHSVRVVVNVHVVVSER